MPVKIIDKSHSYQTLHAYSGATYTVSIKMKHDIWSIRIIWHCHPVNIDDVWENNGCNSFRMNVFSSLLNVQFPLKSVIVTRHYSYSISYRMFAACHSTHRITIWRGLAASHSTHIIAIWRGIFEGVIEELLLNPTWRGLFYVRSLAGGG